MCIISATRSHCHTASMRAVPGSPLGRHPGLERLGTVVVVKEPCRASLTPLAVPMPLGQPASRLARQLRRYRAAGGTRNGPG